MENNLAKNVHPDRIKLSDQQKREMIQREKINK